jgi:hypothetical protein
MQRQVAGVINLESPAGAVGPLTTHAELINGEVSFLVTNRGLQVMGAVLTRRNPVTRSRFAGVMK